MPRVHIVRATASITKNQPAWIPSPVYNSAPGHFSSTPGSGKNLVVKRQRLHHPLERRRHDIERENLAAQEVLERVKQEDDRRDFENPKREHRERVGDEKLDESRHRHRNGEPEPRDRLCRQGDCMPEVKHHAHHRNDRRDRVKQPVAQKQADTVPEVIERLGEEGIDEAVADVRRDLPLVLGGRDEVVHHHRHHEIKIIAEWRSWPRCSPAGRRSRSR